MHFFHPLCIPHAPPFSSWFYHPIIFGQKCKLRINRRNGEGKSNGNVTRLVLTCTAPENEYCGSRLERQACQKHSDLPSCMITSPSSITTPWLLPKRFSYTLRGTNEQCKSISSHNPLLYDRWRSSVSCVWSRGVLTGCVPFIFCTLVLFMWWIVMAWKERQFQLLLTTKHKISACFNKRRDKSGNDVFGPGILKPIVVGPLGVSWTPKITERTWWLKFGTDSVRVASSRYHAILGRGQKFETQTLMSVVAGSKEWFVFYCWKTEIMTSNLTQDINEVVFLCFITCSLVICRCSPCNGSITYTNQTSVKKKNKKIVKLEILSCTILLNRVGTATTQQCCPLWLIKPYALKPKTFALSKDHDIRTSRMLLYFPQFWTFETPYQPIYHLKNSLFYTQGVFVCSLWF